MGRQIKSCHFCNFCSLRGNISLGTVLPQRNIMLLLGWDLMVHSELSFFTSCNRKPKSFSFIILMTIQFGGQRYMQDNACMQHRTL